MSRGEGRQRVRIIGGEHRGRVLHFSDRRDLRPTADRVRETLFNWLQPEIPGARVLDLFAGSGALGFESLSRGASRVVMIDQSSAVVSDLRRNADRLKTGDRLETLQGDALAWLETVPTSEFDIVFVDPPFALDLVDAVLRRLAARSWLAPNAAIYTEQAVAGKKAKKPVMSSEVPESWRLDREKVAGDVCFRLFRKSAD
jgi:16S rRNA (guanine966-N2)-methyltransferase